jgi:transposase
LIFVGHDWAEAHHDVVVMNEAGEVLGSARLGEGLAGVRGLHTLVSQCVDDPAEVVVGTETDRGLFVAAMVATGYAVFAINPKAVDRYRDRHRLAGGKSDAADAKVLADLVRTDRHLHRPIAADTDCAEALKVLSRAHKDLIWRRQDQVNHLRSALREYYPAVLAIFGNELAHPGAVAVLALAPTPEQGRALSTGDIAARLRQAGRECNVQARAEVIYRKLQTPQLTAPSLLSKAYGATTAAVVGILTELNRQITVLETPLTELFDQHPDARIHHSLPGLGTILGARILSEFGDDPHRYASAKARKNYAGTAPITRQSGNPAWSPAAAPAINVWPMPATGGRFAPSRPVPAPGGTTTNCALAAKPTTAPYGNSPTAGSASSTAAYATTPSTTKHAPGHPAG